MRRMRRIHIHHPQDPQSSPPPRRWGILGALGAIESMRLVRLIFSSHPAAPNLAAPNLAAPNLAAPNPAGTAGSRRALVGYSMGSFLGVLVAAKAARVRAVVLAAGGDLPDGTPFARLVRTVADPIRAVRALAGRPLLMVHGRSDRTVTPAQARRLFDAAREPKELRWWNAGHYLPTAAIDEAAVWLRARIGTDATDERSA